MSTNNFNPSYMFDLFSLLSEARKYHQPKALSTRLAARGVHFNIGIDFWIRLLKACHLIDPSPTLQPTPLCKRWLQWGVKKQVILLLEGWAQMITNKDAKQRRIRIFETLKNSSFLLSEMLTKPAYQREIRCIQLLGLFKENKPTPFAWQLFNDHIRLPHTSPWYLNNITNQLIVPLPAQWINLWELESFLVHTPTVEDNQLIYDLNPDKLRQQLSSESLSALLELLETSVNLEIPESWHFQFMKPIPLIAQQGFLLTCCDSEYLIRLRSHKTLGGIFEKVVGPNHVFIPHDLAIRDLQKLNLANMIEPPVEFLIPSSSVDLTFDQTLCFDMIKLAWFAKINDLEGQLPLAQFKKLTALLPNKLTLLAIQTAEYSADKTAFLPNNASEIPLSEVTSILAQLQEAIDQLKCVTIQYRKENQNQIEERKIAPLLIERRGRNDYLVAFCEKRCDRRIFRIDRIVSLHT